MKEHLKYILWVFPFFAFCLGYLAMAFLFKPTPIPTPALIGKTLPEALALTAAGTINLRLLEQRLSEDLPEGTILSQTPRPGTPIKNNQSIYVVISKRAALSVMPDFYHKSIHEINAWAEKHKVTLETSALAQETMPHGHCFAQYPAPGAPVAKHVTIYYADTAGAAVIMPSLQGKAVPEVLSFLNLHGPTANLIHTRLVDATHQCDTCTVLDQRPLAGSLMILAHDKPLQVQLQVG